MNWQKKAALLGGLAIWYAFVGPSTDQLKNKKEYPLPDEIHVLETSLPSEIRQVGTSTDASGKEKGEPRLERIVRTADIDFSRDFSIETDRYKLVHDEDWLPSRLIGHVLSIPGKVIFLDWDYGWGQDEQRAKAALSMLENNKEIRDLTVRLNHNEAIADMVKMFSDDKLSERNNLLARIIMGIPLSVGHEIWAEFMRGSYYNPLTRTAVCYSNIESITAHEIGHHEDFQRFDSDWGYMLSRIAPPVTLYQEWQASQNAKSLLSDDDQNQFNRYLLPAFLTYLIAGYYLSKRTLQVAAMKHDGDKRDLKKVPEDERPEIHPLQTLRKYGIWNLNLYAGIATYHLCESAHDPDPLKYVGFLAGALIANKVANTVMKRIVPYEHEEIG